MTAQLLSGITPSPHDQCRDVRRLLGTQSRTLLDPLSRHSSRLVPAAPGTNLTSRASLANSAGRLGAGQAPRIWTRIWHNHSHRPFQAASCPHHPYHVKNFLYLASAQFRISFEKKSGGCGIRTHELKPAQGPPPNPNRRSGLYLMQDHKAEGVGFEPTRTVTSSSGFHQDRTLNSPDQRQHHS